MELDELPTNALTCTHCETTIQEGQKYCVSCGYPQGGTAGEKSQFHSNRIIEHSKTKDAPNLIRKARNALFIIAAISFLYGLFLFFVQDDLGSLIASSVLAIIYLGLGYWSQQKPLIALILALLVYLTTLVLNGILEPETIAKGLILKGVIVFFLVKGINSALHLRKSQQA